jgi:Kef-type K+ transport system membrane component KefB
LALFLGVAICVSAIPVIAKILLELRLMHRDIGQLILSAAAVTDCVGWLLLSVVAALATAGVRAGQIGLSLGYLVGLLLVTWLVGRPTVHGVMRLAERGGNRSSTITATVVLLLLSAAATQAMGLEDIFGAFLCGILIGRTPGFDRARLAPLNTFTMAVLAPIFFATVGLRLDLNALRSTPLLVTGLLILAVAVLGKFSGAYLGARLSKLTHWEGLALGSGLNSRGVVEVVIAQAGLRLGILTTGTYTVLVLTAVATTMMAPPLLRRAAGRIAPNPGEFVRQERLRTLEDQPASTVTYG